MYAYADPGTDQTGKYSPGERPERHWLALRDPCAEPWRSMSLGCTRRADAPQWLPGSVAVSITNR